MDVDQLLYDLWDSRIPINVEQIANAWGVEIVRGDDGEGLTQVEDKEGGGIQIRIPLGEPVEDQRLRIAHGLGRLLQVTRNQTAANPDAEARKEALRILMPEEVMAYVVKERGIRDIEPLARTLQVNPQLVRVRLEQLGFGE
jgi:hypothetical protein